MIPDKLSPERESALMRLMDDESSFVQEAVQGELKRLGESGIRFLQKLVESRNRIIAANSRQLLEKLGGPDPVEAYRRYIRSLKYDIESGCLMLDRSVYPNMDPAETCILLDAMAARCRELIIFPSDHWERCKVLNRVIFHEFGFRGNSEDFDDPRNSFIHQVIKRRKGIPLTLSVIYILVGFRCGIELHPIGFPGRFVVGCFEDEPPFYIDAFERGCFRSPEELQEILQSNNIPPKIGYYSPIPVGEVLCRCCRNLTRSYTLRNDPAMARMFAGFIRDFNETYQRHAQP